MGSSVNSQIAFRPARREWISSYGQIRELEVPASVSTARVTPLILGSVLDCKNWHAERRVIQPTLAREGMRYWRLQPDVRLRPWILCYWMVEPDGKALELTPVGPGLFEPKGQSPLNGILRFVFARDANGDAASFSRLTEGRVDTFPIAR